MRADIELARTLGMSLRRFHGWEPDKKMLADGVIIEEPEMDNAERMIQRAYQDWKKDRCPGCGNSLQESLWDFNKPASEQAQWKAHFFECRACEVLSMEQQKLSKSEQKMHAAKGENALPLPTGHRFWEVVRKIRKVGS